MLKFSDIKVGQTLKSGTVRMTVISVTEKKAKAIQVFNGKCIRSQFWRGGWETQSCDHWKSPDKKRHPRRTGWRGFLVARFE